MKTYSVWIRLEGPTTSLTETDLFLAADDEAAIADAHRVFERRKECLRNSELEPSRFIVRYLEIKDINKVGMNNTTSKRIWDSKLDAI